MHIEDTQPIDASSLLVPKNAITQYKDFSARGAHLNIVRNWVDIAERLVTGKNIFFRRRKEEDFILIMFSDVGLQSSDKDFSFLLKHSPIHLELNGSSLNCFKHTLETEDAYTERYGFSLGGIIRRPNVCVVFDCKAWLNFSINRNAAFVLV